MSAQALLTVTEIVRTFGGIRAVDGVSFDVQRGEVFGIIGPNGAGKTALLNCLNGVYPVQSGQITFDGRRIEDLAPHRVAALGIGRTFQSTEYFKDFKVLDYLMLGRAANQSRSMFGCALALGRVRRREDEERQRCFEVLRRLGLGRYAREQLSSLPYGITKQVDMARGMAAEPHIMLLDEPTSGVTLRERGAMGDTIDQMRETGVTTLVVDHDVSFITRVCKRMLVMNFGRVLGVGTPAELFARPDVASAYLGE